MPLQSDDLTLIALGVQNDVPPFVTEPRIPALVNGIHLRWAFPRPRGFPWFGYYLFRRPYQMRGVRCLAAALHGKPVGSTGSTILVTPDGTFSSDTNIALTDSFPAVGDVEVDLLNRTYLLFELPAGEMAYRVDVRIGFRAAGSVDISAYDAGMQVASAKLTQKGGAAPESVTLKFDRITSVRISGANAAVIELCWYPVSAGVTQNWAAVPNLTQPITLPLTHPDYPAAPGAINLTDAQRKGLGRIVYGQSTKWGGAPFASLHEQLILLVQGGPPGPPERAMAHLSRAISNVAGVPEPPAAGVESPSIPSIHPLDLVLLSAMHAPFAQILGLYHADQMAVAGVAYDYLLIADYPGVAGGKVSQMQALITAGDFSQVDARITFNQQMAPAPPLAPPTGVRVYALPGGTSRSTTEPGSTIVEAKGNAGLLWELPPMSPQGKLVNGSPVMYHVWRDRQGNGNNPAPSATAGELVTTGGPLLITNPHSAPTETPQYGQDCPPFGLRITDFALSEGWYGYQVNSIDLFGRYSPRSNFAEWRQWAPLRGPAPWYYINPNAPADRQVHPSSVRLLDKLPPPPPAAVEAWALDPQDPMVIVDPKYTTWRQSLPATLRNQLVGLRVRWQWRVGQQRQAPDTAEFRVYFHPGTQLPQSWEMSSNWETRCFVCAYGDGNRFTVDDEGNRSYEVFIPTMNEAGPFTDGIPLNVDLAAPLAYANVTVTAADSAAHTPDTRSGNKALANRTGNESRAAAPQKIFRVLRERPAPPPPVVDSPRVYATPADWYGRSFHTFRWAPQANLNIHVLRAMDESVFAADWAVRPRPDLLAGDLQRFPNEPTWDDTKRRNVCRDLNQLNSFPRTAAGKRAALAAYRRLNDDALRVLTGLPGCEKAFTQITIAPLISAEHPDRRGPDDESNYTPRANVHAWLDTLDGRATNRYLYRAMTVDAVQNRSELGPCGTPVRLPNVTPPRPPVITRIAAGDRSITLNWASNRESDLLEYRVYRAASPEAARDLRYMELVGTVAAADDPALRPATVQWTHTPVRGLIDYWYRVVAVDRFDAQDLRGRGGNLSPPSPAVKARALQPLPSPPVLQPPVLNAARNQLVLTWQLPDPGLQPRVERRIDETGVWVPVTSWLQAGTLTTTVPLPGSSEWEYRIRVRDHAQQRSASDPQPAP